MDQNFQTSFIPKKPMIEERTKVSRPIGFFAVISIFILFAMLIGSAGLYFYQGFLSKNITTMESSLNTAKSRFEPTKITELQLLDKRLRASNEILSKHTAITPIFDALGSITMNSVRYTKFSYDFNRDDKNPKISVKISGLAQGYRAIALQSDLFTTKEIGKHFIDPVFSNLTLDDKGNVLFDLDFSVDASFVDYKQMVSTSTQN